MLKQLRYFQSVVRLNSFSEAAEKNFISQSAISQQIQALERELGFPLLERKNRTFALTPAGECVNAGARDITIRLERLASELHPFVRLESGTIRVVANYGASMDILPDLITRYLLENPGHHVNLSRRTSEDVVEQVSSDRADIGVCVPVSTRRNVEFLPYIQDYLVLIVPDGHPLARHDAVEMVEALDHAFVVLGPDVPMQAYVHQKLREQGLHLRERLEADDQHLLMQFVKSGLGIGVLTLRTARYAPSGIRIVRLKDDWAVRPLQIVVKKDRETLSDNARRFLDYLLERRPAKS